MGKITGLSIAVDKTARMFILHPFTNEPLFVKNADGTAGEQAYIDIYSKDSQRARTYNRNATQKKLDMRGRATISALSLENENYGLLAELSTGWLLVDIETGEKIDVPFTTLNAREIYSNPEATWLFEQVDAFAGARGNFSKPSATNSPPLQNGNSDVAGG
jgi:hypothetical protein